MSFDNRMFPHLMRRYRGANIILFVLAIRIVSFIPSTDFVMQKKCVLCQISDEAKRKNNVYFGKYLHGNRSADSSSLPLFFVHPLSFSRSLECGRIVTTCINRTAEYLLVGTTIRSHSIALSRGGTYQHSGRSKR